MKRSAPTFFFNLGIGALIGVVAAGIWMRRRKRTTIEPARPVATASTTPATSVPPATVVAAAPPAAAPVAPGRETPLTPLHRVLSVLDTISESSTTAAPQKALLAEARKVIIAAAAGGLTHPSPLALLETEDNAEEIGFLRDAGAKLQCDVLPHVPATKPTQPSQQLAAVMRRISELHGLPSDVLTRVATILGTSSVNLDLFSLDKETEARSCYFVGLHLFHKYHLVEEFRIDPDTLTRFLMAVNDGYNDMPYHNSVHAADVSMTLDWLLQQPPFGVTVHLTPLQHLALIIAALCHDLGHTGHNNPFEINARTELALTYNDKSVLENHHCHLAFELLRLQAPETNILGALTPAQYKELRELVIDLILATDMAQHFPFLAEVEARVADPKATTKDLFDPVANPKDLRLLLKMALKCSDLGHCAKEDTLHTQWVALITHEFHLQSDQEKALGLPLTPQMKRDSNVLRGQVGFFQNVVLPMYKLGNKLMDMHSLAAQAVANHSAWKAKSHWHTAATRVKAVGKLSTLPVAPGQPKEA